MTRAEKAKQYFLEGYACSQAVLLAFSDLTKVSQADLINLSLPFGGGLGRQRLTCGAVSGMCMALGLILGEKNLSKAEVYEETRKVCSRFKEAVGSLICEELLKGANCQVESGGNPEKRTETYYKKRPCADLVYLATEILSDYLLK